MSRVNPLSSLSLLAVLVLAGCSSQAPQPLKKGEKAIDVASVVRQKMPASVKDRDAWAKDLASGKLYLLLQRNALRAPDQFEIPPNRVIELGTQVEI